MDGGPAPIGKSGVVPAAETVSVASNDPNGSRPEPGVRLIASFLLLPLGEAPEGRARGDQDTATRVQSESER